MPKEYRLTVRCVRDPLKHAKLLKIDGLMSREYVETFAGLLDGTSKWYTFPPGPQSPIGKCGICGSLIECTIEEIEIDADSKK